MIKNRIARLLIKGGVSANFLTGLGLGMALGAAFLIYRGSFRWAAGTLLLSGLCDLLDGAVARASKTAGGFGGVLDSSLDRYGDGFIFSGILFYCLRNGKTWYGLLAMSALLGSFLISYVRARAECEGHDCRVGFWERGERIVYISLGLLFNNLGMALWVLGIATHYTALQRLYCAYGRSSARFLKGVRPSRHSPAYLIKAGILFFTLLLFRPLF